jgi:adenylate cyclase
VYLGTHLANHALGLLSLAAMESGRLWFLALWRSLPGSTVLYGALLVHLGLALRALYQRHHLRMPGWEALQLILGLLIPPLLISHVTGTYLAHTWFGVLDSYTRVVLVLWELRPALGILQSILLTIAWLHGCIGFHFWLRLRPWYPRLAPLCFAVALLLPVLALLGFAQAGREISVLARQPGWITQTLQETHTPKPAQQASLERLSSFLRWGYVVSIGGVLLARLGRRLSERRWIRITYPGGRVVRVPVGLTVLEASRMAGIPHASVCGGRGRCSTCRVLVGAGAEFLPQVTAEEQRVLKRVGAAAGMRLACQVRPLRDVSITPLLPGHALAQDSLARPGYGQGQEREIAILFADLRGFTALAEHKLPYDVVFFLNRYFEAVGGAIERAGGIVNQFTGDGVMALFGVHTGAADGSRRALQAAAHMTQAVAQLSQALAGELATPLQLGIGVHTGPAVVGHMGYRNTVYLTAVGDTVHVASRLEGLTKEYGCQLVISGQVAVRSGIAVARLPRHELTVRNRQEPLTIYLVEDSQQLLADFALMEKA